MTTNSRSMAALLAVSAIALCSALTACGSTDDSADASGTSDNALNAELPKSIKSSGVLKIGADWTTPPIISVKTSNTSVPVGIAPDLASSLASQLGVKLSWQNMQWPAQLPGLQSGGVDALFGQVTDTAEREQSDFDLVPFFKTGNSLLLLKSEATGVKSLSDVCGKKLGAPVGSTQIADIKAQSAKLCADNPIEVAEYQGGSATINAVKSKAIDAWLDNSSTQEQAVKADPSTLTAVVVPESQIPANFTAIAVSKKQGPLATALAEAFTKIIEDGTYEKVMTKYSAESSMVTADEVKVNPVTGTPAGTSK